MYYVNYVHIINITFNRNKPKSCQSSDIATSFFLNHTFKKCYFYECTFTEKLPYELFLQIGYFPVISQL